MLKGLFGNRTVGRILLFLFVNEKGYGGQMQSLLEMSLTPIQNALQRLEKEGVVTSQSEGKTRIYEINSMYPLRAELEQLLKKAYTLLPPKEKRQYCFAPRKEISSAQKEREKRKALLAFWKRLSQVRHLEFSAKSRDMNTLQVGKAEVEVDSPNNSTLVFREKGYWYHEQIPHTAFYNVFRWTLDSEKLLVVLEHLRYGPSNPVFLLNFTPTKPSLLESVDAHLCAEDTYLGAITWKRSSIDLQWKIIGPHKNSELMYRYTDSF